MGKKNQLWILVPFLLLFGICCCTSESPPLIAEGTSPDNRYAIQIRGEKGEGILNVPVYITIYGDTVESEVHTGKLCRISTQIDNDSGGVTAKSNVWLFWESNSQATIILMGEEQIPEIIQISFQTSKKDTKVINIRSSKMAREILQNFQVDIESIPSRYW